MIKANLILLLPKLRDLANKFGLKYTDEQWSAMIESSVIEAKKDWGDITKASINDVVSVSNTSTDTITPNTNSDSTQTVLKAESDIVSVNKTPETVATVDVSVVCRK